MVASSILGLIAVLQKGDGSWALSDFGFSVEKISGQLQESSKLRMTPQTCAPELLKDGGLHDERLDIWGFGCVAYILATGEFPFKNIRNHFDLFLVLGSLRQDEIPSLGRDDRLLITDQDTGLDLNYYFVNRILQRSLQLDPKNRSYARSSLEFVKQQELLWRPQKSISIDWNGMIVAVALGLSLSHASNTFNNMTGKPLSGLKYLIANRSCLGTQ